MDFLNIVLYLWILHYLYFSLRCRRVNGPPAYYFFPFLGIIPILFTSKSVFRALWSSYLKNLPDVIVTHYFWAPLVVVKNSAVIDVQNSKQCLSRKSNAFEKVVGYVTTGNPYWFVFDDNSEECDWRSIRKTNVAALHILSKRQKFERVAEAADNFLSVIEDQGGRLWNYHDNLFFAKIQETTNVNLGDTFDKDDIWAFVEFMRPVQNKLARLVFMCYIPLEILKLIQPLLPRMLRLDFLKRNYAKITSGLLEMKMREIDEPKDFIEAVLKIRKPGSALDFIRESGLFNMVASTHTTQHSTIAALSYISLEERIQQKIHEELDRVVGSSPLKYEHLSNLHYLRAVIHEAFRISPPVALLMRLTSGDARIGGCTVASNTRVLLLLASETEDATKFPNPDDFIPERYITEDGSFEGGNDFNVFSRGKRMCSGSEIAILSNLVYCAKILQHFHLSPEKKDIKLPRYHGTIINETPLIPLRFVRREGAPVISPVSLKANLSAFLKKTLESRTA